MNATGCRKAVHVVLGFALAALPIFGQIKAPARWIDPQSGAARRSILDEVNFETDTSVVATGFPTLACAAEAAKRDTTIFYVVEGYADGRGGAEYNLRLSEARARSVADYLVFLGVPAGRLQAVGRGKAGLPSDKITNFVNRKAIVIPHRGAFDGPVMDRLPVEGLPCGTHATLTIPGQVPSPAARIEINGQTFLINVNYSRIRSDLRGEIRQALAEDRALQSIHEDAAPRDGAGDPDPMKDASRISAPRSEAQAPTQPSSGNASSSRGGGAFFEAFGVSTNLKVTEKAMGRLAAGCSFPINEEGVFQVGFQGEFGSYRRKLQGDLAFGLSRGAFRGAAFLSYASVSGVALDMTGVPVVTGMMGGARLGLEWPWFGMGLTYATASTPAAATTGPAQDPAGVALCDLRFDWSRFQTRIWGGGAKLQDRNSLAQSLSGKGFGGAELSWYFQEGAAVVVRGESLPIYEALAYQGKAETRFSMGLRFGGAAAPGAQWIPVPAARLVFPF